MKPDSAVTLFAKGLVSAGMELSRCILSPRTASGFWKSIYTYPLSPVFRTVSTPRKGAPLPDGTCVVFNAGYGASLFGLEGLPPYDTHRFGNIYSRLVSRKVLTPAMIDVPDQISDEDLLLVHGEEYVNRLADAQKVAEILEVPIIRMFPTFAVNKIVSAFRYQTGGTLLAAHLALEHGLAVNLGGGFHHARPHRGGGFCLMADIPVAIKKIREDAGPLRVLVVDLDVHQGDGTIACMAEDRRTFIFSMHQAEIFPYPKEVGDLDVIITAGTGDGEYLRLLDAHLPEAFEKANPDLVFYVAGADVLKDDPLASINLSADGLIRRDQTVAAFCRDKKIPMVMTLAGGYSPGAAIAQSQSIENLISP